MALPKSNAPKRCSRNCKQCRPWSECSSRSSLIWVCTVCPDLSVRKLRNITVLVVINSCMKWKENNLCLSWILFRGRAIVHFTSGQFSPAVPTVLRIVSAPADPGSSLSAGDVLSPRPLFYAFLLVTRDLVLISFVLSVLPFPVGDIHVILSEVEAWWLH